MTPKEKAIELVDEFIDKSVVIDDDGLVYYHPKPYDLAKQCALVAVVEIMSTVDAEDNVILYNYWQQVKQQIQKI